MTAQLAKRAFVNFLLALAAAYGLILNVTRDSADADLVSAFKRVVRKAHPDKGGSVADTQRLHAARDAWKDAQTGHGRGRPSASTDPGGGAADSSSGAQRGGGMGESILNCRRDAIQK